MASNNPPLSEGWIARHRSVREHWLVGHGLQVKPADPSIRRCLTQGEAWEDLLMECRYEDGFVQNGGRKMRLERGSLVGAVSWLGARWNWTPQTVRTFLDKLEDDGMISRHVPGASESNKHVGKASTVITVCNYSQFQSTPDRAQQTDQQTNSKQATNDQQTSNNIYKDNKGTKEQGNKEVPPKPPKGGEPDDRAFEEFWSAFPGGRKKGKGEARDAFRKIVTGRHRKGLRAKAETLIAAAIRYAASKPDPEFTPMPSTWLNGGRWEDDAQASADPPPTNGMSWGWWRGKEDVLRGLPLDRWRDAVAKSPPNGTWPWWRLGAPPGHPECLVPEPLVTENNWIEIYHGSITHA